MLIQADGYRHQTKICLEGKSETELGFNLNHLADALRQFKGESRVRMKLTGPLSTMNGFGTDNASSVLQAARSPSRQ